MSGLIRLAWNYLWHYRVRSLILLLCIFLTLVLPICLAILLSQFSRSIVARANATPTVVGAKGSKLDLALHAIYFSAAPDSTIAFSEVQQLRESGLATAIPVHGRFTAQGFPVVGTTLRYFSYRDLEIQSGNLLAILGDCVVGADVARELGVGVGDFVLTDRGNVLDLAGEYPLRLKVVGVLSPSATADDRGVFVDIKTAWVIEGLGHGHQDLAKADDENLLLGDDNGKLVASPAVLPFTEITAENLGSFHFHGDTSDFPVSCILVSAPDEKNATILEGRFRNAEGNVQMIRPPSVIEQLMGLVFQVKRFFDVNAVLVALATLLLLGLVVLLSVRLREREMQTMFRMGCSRGTMAWIQITELAFVFMAALCLVAAACVTVWYFAEEIVQRCINGSV